MLQELIKQYFPEETKVEKEEAKQIFKLPISYLPKEKVFSLNPVVSNDLELMVTENNEEKRGMYDYLFHPQHQFALDIIPLWNTQFTTDSIFLTESQKIVQDLSIYKGAMETNKYIISHESLMEIWTATRQDNRFLDKYNYIEWDMLKHLNENTLFLQSISLANMISPIISFIIPIIFLILPFAILKIQGQPITVEIYIDVLKDIAKHHFIGKTLTSLQSLDIQNIAYMVFTFCMYVYQIYQNIVSCSRFYSNIQQINSHLYEITQYMNYSLRSMRSFIDIIETCTTYSVFRQELIRHYNTLLELKKELGNIQPFSPSILKLTEIGDLLKAYYVLYDRDDFAESLKYSFGFEGYMNNLLGLYENLSLNRVSFATFDLSLNTSIEGGYYPSHMAHDYVTNDCSFNENMVITGPNASGKTTFLKTVMINIIFSQQTGYGFYSGCILNPYTHIHSYLNIPDTSGRDSLFQAESRRCKDILDIIKVSGSNSHHLCTFDELYSGTNPEEATKSAYSFLLYLAKNENVDFILTTHYTSICSRLKKEKNIETWKMDAVVGENDGIKYTYKIRKGVSKIQGAVSILKEMDYPKEILDGILDWK